MHRTAGFCPRTNFKTATKNGETEMRFDVSKLEIGQEVGFSGVHDHFNGFGKITKINGHGHITVARTFENGNTEEIIFDKRGNERGRKYYGRYLCDTAELKLRIAEKDAERERERQIQAVVDFLQSNRYSGKIYINAEAKTKLLELVNAITTIK